MKKPKMKIGLIDMDGHNYPNLALMKISAYHKSIGDSVEWVSFGNYDKTYISKIFSFTPEIYPLSSSLGEIVKGGTGYNFETLPKQIDSVLPDYSIYPRYKEAYGFLTRGCPNKCNYCIVPQKEGDIKPYNDIETILNGRKIAILLDNNVLASEWGIKQLIKIVDLKVKVDFNQGLDARIIAQNEDIAELLGQVKWYKPIRMACDSLAQMEHIEKATNLLRKHNATPRRYFVYVLVKDIEDAHKRVEFLRKLNVSPFAQPYIDFNNNIMSTKKQKKFARWVNHKATFNSCSWNNYNK